MSVIFLLLVLIMLIFSCKNVDSKNHEISIKTDSDKVIKKDTISFDFYYEKSPDANLKSELQYNLLKLRSTEYNYQIIEIGELEISKSIVYKGIKKLPELLHNKQYYEVKNIDLFKEAVNKINYAHIKGTKDLGGKLYPRAKIEELVFKSEDLADRLVQFISKVNLWKEVDKSPHSIFNKKNKVYYISSGGHFMKSIYKEIEHKMIK